MIRPRTFQYTLTYIFFILSSASRRFSSCPRKLNLLVSDKGSISHSATKPPHSSYSALSGNTSQPFPSTRCKSLPVSKLSVQTTSSLSPCKLAQSSLSHSPSFDSYIPKTGKIGQLKSVSVKCLFTISRHNI